MIRSLQARLFLGASAVAALALASAALAIYFSVRAALLAEFDGTLLASARGVASIIEQNDGRIVVELDPSMLPEFARAEHPDYFVVWSSAGTVVGQSPSAAGTALLHKPHPAREQQGFFIDLPGGRRGRGRLLRFIARTEQEEQQGLPASRGPTLTLLLARETAPVNRALGRLAWLLAGVSIATTLLSGTLMALVVRRGVRPVTALAAGIAAVRPQDLASRLDLPGAPQELRPIIDRLNDLLERIDAAFSREKSFSADVAHELRTPLAGLEAALEVCAMRPREPEAYQQTITRCLLTIRTMHAMVEKLLLLSRLESQQIPVRSEPVHLAALLQETFAPLAERARERRLDVRVQIPPDLVVRTDPSHLQIILHNLMENAVCYTNEGGSIRAGASARESQVTVQIANTGCSLSAEDVEKAFQRFWRADDARSQANLHAGLGLSLARRVAEVLSGSLTARSIDGEFEVTLVLPWGNPPVLPFPHDFRAAPHADRAAPGLHAPAG